MVGGLLLHQTDPEIQPMTKHLLTLCPLETGVAALRLMVLLVLGTRQLKQMAQHWIRHGKTSILPKQVPPLLQSPPNLA